MDPSRLERLVRMIYRTEDEEISCSECFDLVAQYVDSEIAGRPVPARLRRLAQHLDQCGVCREEYEVLRELARLETEGQG